MFKINNLSFGYKNSQPILDIKNWGSTQGEHWLLLGSSGSGKTTLLHIMAGLRRASKGDVYIGKENIQSLSTSKLDKYRGANIGIIFQKPHLIDSLSVLDNLLLAQNMAGLRKDKKHCEGILKRLNVIEKKNKFPNELSSGQAQRISVARALVNNPTLVLADEPTASLDDENAQEVIKLLKEQSNNNNSTLIIATHDQRVKNNFEKQFLL